jgi:hypothetical protein
MHRQACVGRLEESEHRKLGQQIGETREWSKLHSAARERDLLLGSVDYDHSVKIPSLQHRMLRTLLQMCCAVQSKH